MVDLGVDTTDSDSEPQVVSLPQGEDLVGCEVRVWWDGDDAWYDGTVDRWSPKLGKHRITYTDGEKKFHAMGEDTWELRSRTPAPASKKDITSAGAAAAAAGGEGDAAEAHTSEEKAADYSLLTTHCALLTTHYSLLTWYTIPHHTIPYHTIL